MNPAWVEWLMGWPIGWTSMERLPPERWEEWMDGRPPEVPVPRLIEGCKDRVKRLTALGNGQVPDCVVAAWKLLSR